MSNSKIYTLLGGIGLLTTWWLKQKCCPHQMDFLTDRPFEPRPRATEEQRRQPPSSSDGGSGGGYRPPTHPSGGSTHRATPISHPSAPSQKGGGSYWDWLKSGGGLNPNNPYHPFPGAIPGIGGEKPAIKVPAWGSVGLERLTIA